jgi:hypothetical protein
MQNKLCNLYIYMSRVSESDVIVAYAISLCGGIEYVPWAKLIEQVSAFQLNQVIRKELWPTLFYKEYELLDYLLITNYVCLGLC